MATEQVIDPATIPVEFRPRIRNVNDDIRLAAGAFNLIDPETWMVFDFIVSNTAIYAFYERLPFAKPFFNGGVLTPLGDYAAFSNAIWVARRSGVNPSNDYQKLAIGLNRSKGTVTWYIDNIPVFTVNTIGLRAHDKFRLLEHGGTEYKVDVKSVRFGFGTFSLLDMALPDNYNRQYTVEVNGQREVSASALVELDTNLAYRELFPDPITGEERTLVDENVTFAYPTNATPDNNRSVKLFGQGSIIRVKTMRVFTKSKCEKPEYSRVNY